HSDPKLTMRVYGRLRLHDLGSAVGRLPVLTFKGDSSESAALPATGTDGRHVPRHVPEHVPAGDSGRGGSRTSGEENTTGPLVNALDFQGIEDERGPESDSEEAPRVGFEPTTRRLTAGCSTVELSRNRSLDNDLYKAPPEARQEHPNQLLTPHP